MADTQPVTYVRIAEVLTDLGMISNEKAQSLLDQVDTYATEPIKRHHEIASALVFFDVAVSIHSDDVDFADQAYGWLLDEAAALTGGKVTVSNYRFEKDNPDDEDCGLGTMHFECNGKPLSFYVAQESNDYLDIWAARQAIKAISLPDDPREFRYVQRKGAQLHDAVMVLATTEQREGLLQQLGITFEPIGANG